VIVCFVDIGGIVDRHRLELSFHKSNKKMMSEISASVLDISVQNLVLAMFLCTFYI